jgi:hypothetical protein
MQFVALEVRLTLTGRADAARLHIHSLSGSIPHSQMLLISSQIASLFTNSR